MGRPVAVFTDHGDPRHFAAYRRAAPPAPGWRPVRALRQACWLWRQARAFPGIAVFVTYGSMTGFALAALQTLARPWAQPRTHVMFDLLLEHPRRGIAGCYDRLKMAMFRRSGARAVVWGQCDVAEFARAYDLPVDRFSWHPYHTTLDGHAYEVRDDGCIFAGGNNGRDYGTLVAALAGVDREVFIATTDPRVPLLARDLPHVTVAGVSPGEFRRRLAACTFVVEAHPRDFFRTAGHQTMLNAMSMGKPVVLADERSAPGYIDDGIEGLVVPAGEVDRLREAIRAMLADPERRQRMGEAGRRRLADPIYDTAIHMQSIYNLALHWEQERLGCASPGARIELYGPAGGGLTSARGVR
jgi:hypothetical protein